jgi:nifR3 family TIM-barrel protein
MKENFWKSLLRPFSVLAPMEDVTDMVFRQLVSECGRPDILYSEFTSTDGMFSPGADNVTHRLEHTGKESPLVAQIWGKKPEHYYRAAQRLVELGFDGIDINMGCPVPKITKSGSCSALIVNPSLARELILATNEGAGDLPVSVKTRIGFRDTRTEEWTGFLLEQDIQALIVHGRIAKHLSKYPADWEEVGKVVKLRDEMKKDIVVVGNGDVRTLDEVKQKHEEYGVDGVMIGRAIFENLFLFDSTQAPLADRSVDEKLTLLLRHVALFEECWGGRKPYRILKKYFKIYASCFDGASELRMRLVETVSGDHAREVVSSWRKEHGFSAELACLATESTNADSSDVKQDLLKSVA